MPRNYQAPHMIAWNPANNFCNNKKKLANLQQNINFSARFFWRDYTLFVFVIDWHAIAQLSIFLLLQICKLGAYKSSAQIIKLAFEEKPFVG